jgi:ferredoxin
MQYLRLCDCPFANFTYLALQCMIHYTQTSATGRAPGSGSRRWRPGKAYDIATSPDGKWLALSFGEGIRLYHLPTLHSQLCADSMKAAEVWGHVADHLLSKCAGSLCITACLSCLAVCSTVALRNTIELPGSTIYGGNAKNSQDSKSVSRQKMTQ